MVPEQKQLEAMQTWSKAALTYASAREAYRVAWAAEFSASAELKPESARKAVCDVKTSDLRRKRDELEIEAAAAWQEFLVLRGPMDHARQPGQNWDQP